MEGSREEQEEELIREELASLTAPQVLRQQWGQPFTQTSIWNAVEQRDPESDPNRHRFNHYADKQLEHLVVAEEFDFAKIAELLSKGPPTQIISSETSECVLAKCLVVSDGRSCTV